MEEFATLRIGITGKIRLKKYPEYSSCRKFARITLCISMFFSFFRRQDTGGEGWEMK